MLKPMETELISLVRKAKQGRREALEAIVVTIQDRIYRMALRMLGHPEDAKDDTQEILIKVITHIGGFREECSFMTWVYRITANHLRSTRKRRMERRRLSFDLFVEAVVPADGQQNNPAGMQPEERLLVEEMKSACVQGMLLCLSREVRLAFILGDIVGVNSEEGAFILDITPAAFRKRASRGRGAIRKFMLANCGVVKFENPCHCLHQAIFDAERGWIDPERLVYTEKKSVPGPDEEKFFEGLDELGRITALFENYPRHPSPNGFVDNIKSLIQRQDADIVSST